MPEGQTYELYWSQDGTTNWVDTKVQISATGTLIQIPVYRLTYTTTSTKLGTAPDPAICYAVNHSSYTVAANTYKRVNYGVDGWSAGSASVTGDTVNAAPYTGTWKVDGADLTLYANWSTACRIYGNVYAGPSSRKYLVGINIVLMDSNGVIADGIVSQDYGYFTIAPTRVLTTGYYTLFASDGSGKYQDTYVTVQVAGNGFGLANIYMDPVTQVTSGGNTPASQAAASKKPKAQAQASAATKVSPTVADKATASAKADPAPKAAAAQEGKPQD
jgi:hypothetical protein